MNTELVKMILEDPVTCGNTIFTFLHAYPQMAEFKASTEPAFKILHDEFKAQQEVLKHCVSNPQLLEAVQRDNCATAVRKLLSNKRPNEDKGSQATPAKNARTDTLKEPVKTLLDLPGEPLPSTSMIQRKPTRMPTIVEFIQPHTTTTPSLRYRYQRIGPEQWIRMPNH